MDNSLQEKLKDLHNIRVDEQPYLNGGVYAINLDILKFLIQQLESLNKPEENEDGQSDSHQKVISVEQLTELIDALKSANDDKYTKKEVNDLLTDLKTTYNTKIDDVQNNIDYNDIYAKVTDFIQTNQNWIVGSGRSKQNILDMLHKLYDRCDEYIGRKHLFMKWYEVSNFFRYMCNQVYVFMFNLGYKKTETDKLFDIEQTNRNFNMCLDKTTKGVEYRPGMVQTMILMMYETLKFKFLSNYYTKDEIDKLVKTHYCDKNIFQIEQQ